MIKYKELHHVSLPVTDLPKSRNFYNKILGLEEIDRPNFDFDGAWFKAGNQQIHLIVFPESQLLKTNREISTRDAHFALQVDDYFAALKWLDEKGVSYIKKPNSKSGFAQIFCSDPDGHIIELNVDQKDLK